MVNFFRVRNSARCNPVQIYYTQYRIMRIEQVERYGRREGKKVCLGRARPVNN